MKIELDFEVLKRISEYYKFPLAAFFIPSEKLDKVFKERTVDEHVQKELEKLSRIYEVLCDGCPYLEVSKDGV